MNAPPETVAWLQRYYALLDSARVREALDEFLSRDCTIRLGNGPPVDFVTEARRMGTLVKGVRHELLTVLEGDDGTLACELKITYVKHDGTEVMLPGALFARIADGRFVEQRAYVDQTPLTS
ncbi:MAG TPA: nuclear transport factor 2 family protein [Solirubrobacteraceae bacterium]|nr:nuclear transport factor 2 family protein [Solirubrobacteraceae bacterium]